MKKVEWNCFVKKAWTDDIDFEQEAMSSSGLDDFLNRTSEQAKKSVGGSVGDGEMKEMLSRIYGYFRPSTRTFAQEKSLYQPVYDFYRDIAPEIRKRDLGVQALPENEVKAYEDIGKIPVQYFDEYPRNTDVADGYSAYYSPGTPEFVNPVNDFLKRMNTDPEFRKSVLSEKRLERNPYFDISRNPLYGSEHIRMAAPASRDDILRYQQILAHELRHSLQERLAANQKNREKLKYLYQISNVGSDVDESETTNVEHQFGEYMRLRNSLGRKPTAAEYFSHIKGMSNKNVENSAFNKVNGYQENSRMKGNRQYMDSLRENYLEALDRISMNGLRMGGWAWGRFLPHATKKASSAKTDPREWSFDFRRSVSWKDFVKRATNEPRSSISRPFVVDPNGTWQTQTGLKVSPSGGTEGAPVGGLTISDFNSLPPPDPPVDNRTYLRAWTPEDERKSKEAQRMREQWQKSVNATSDPDKVWSMKNNPLIVSSQYAGRLSTLPTSIYGVFSSLVKDEIAPSVLDWASGLIR